MEVNKSIFRRQADFLEKNGKYILQFTSITRKGKNWYITVEGCIITVNAHSFTIITAHKEKNNKEI